jgi:ADP-ribosyl-[dinitrogen reductase] hydrolase
MALALADSIRSGWDLNDQAERYLNWRRLGVYSVNGRCFDIGVTTARALDRFERSRDARSSGDPSARASGNGSIMRLAPVAIRFAAWYPANVGQLLDRAEESSLPTHASAPCRSSCRYLALVLAALMNGVDRDAALDPVGEVASLARAHGSLHPAIAEVVDGSFRRRRPPEIVGSGYVVKSLEAALWAFHGAADFREAVLRAVNLGDDADTSGAVCGQLAGANWGESGIPAEWRDDLARWDLINSALDGLLAD